MDKEHSIDISMTPHYHDNKHKPYFWVIFEHTDVTVNTGLCGWAETPQLAWEEASRTFGEFYK